MAQFRVVTGTPAEGPAMALRETVFRRGRGDRDIFDDGATPLVVCASSGQVVAACRLTVLHDLRRAYSAQFHDLRPLAVLGLPGIELGRLCTAPGLTDPDALRALWAGVAAEVVEAGAAFLFGVTSLFGADPASHAGALAALAGRIGPWEVVTKARAAVPLTATVPPEPAALPPILRGYLAMGAFVAGQAVPDLDLDTLHVLTVLPVAAIPPARLRTLRALAVDLSRASP